MAAPKLTVTEAARREDLLTEIADFQRLGAFALGDLTCPKCGNTHPTRPDMRAVVTARGREREAKDRLFDFDNEVVISRMRDPAKRADARARCAAGKGSWVAHTQLDNSAKKLRAEQEAEKQRRLEMTQSDVEAILSEVDRAIESLPEALRDRWLDSLNKKYRR